MAFTRLFWLVLAGMLVGLVALGVALGVFMGQLAVMWWVRGW